MKVDSPNFKRCCFCLPLRKGLICWGYFNLVINALTIVYFALVFLHALRGNVVVHFGVLGPFVAVLLIQIAFNLVLVVACHKKSAKLLKVSYIYSIVYFVLILGIGAFVTFTEFKMLYVYWDYYSSSISKRIFRMFIVLATLFLQIFVQMYVILLIHSEMMKLRHQSIEMRFVNNAAEGEERCVGAGRPDDPDYVIA